MILWKKNHDEPIIQLVACENFFEILNTIRKNIVHEGRDKMMYALKDKYYIPNPIVPIFYKLCNVCNLKKSQQHKNIVVKPILSKDFNVRGQVDLIDFQSTPSEKVEAFEGRKKTAEKMIQASDQKLVIIEVGNYVLVNIPKVDRGPLGPLDTQNIIGKVIDNKNNVYQIGTRFEIINTWLSRNVLQTSDAEFLDELPDTMLKLRKIVNKHSQFGGQGYQKCFCKTSCKTNRCACRKNNVLCSSICHEKTSCNNNNII
ncbi:hypothetical protein AGLY_002957 [Aphis glycines]|uniref:Uncharacterized protein n=1 Tax=Aphis glycines TaxID=307491 RepID=A0A6G0U497_APHGL|nr:hypothetical protein AGLY_002957 [Aphis glycines]